MLGREVVEAQQAFTVLDQTLCGLVVFCAVGCDEEVEGGFGVGPSLGHPDVVQMALGFGLQGFGHLVEHVGGLVDPATLHPGLSVNLA